MELDSNLRFFRQEKGYSQEKVARMVNLDRCEISLYETGDRTPSIETLIKFANIYQITVEELLGIGEYEKISQISRLLISVSDADMEFIIELLEAYLKINAKHGRRR